MPVTGKFRSQVLAESAADGEQSLARKHRFRPDIEGLRAIAVMLVVADHLKIPGFKGGFLGVDVFFVISGFLITFLLAREFENSREGGSAGRISIRGFYLRRARRILPASFLVIAAVLIAAKLLFNIFRFEEVQASALWATFFLANFDLMHQATDYFAQTNAVSPLQNYWSLAVEEQFYIVWPLLFMVAARLGWTKRKRDGHNWRGQATTAILILTGTSLLWSIIATGDNSVGAYFSPFTRAYELGIGATVAILVPAIQARMTPHISRLSGLSGLALIALGLFVLGPATPYPGAWALIPTVAAALLIIAGLCVDLPNPAGAALSVRPARFLGRISYSIYLWHWPIIVFATAEYGALANPVKSLILLPSVILIAWVSYRFVEQPFRKVGKGTGSTRNFLAGLKTSVARRQLGAMSALTVVVLGSIAAFARPLPPTSDSAALIAKMTQDSGSGTAASEGPSSGRVALIDAGLRVKNATPTEMSLIGQARKGAALTGRFCDDSAKTQAPPAPDCYSFTTGAPGSLDELKGKKVVLVGNSYVVMWTAAIASSLPPTAHLTSLAAGACVPYDFRGRVLKVSPFFDVDCAKWAKWEIDQVKLLKPALVIISSAPLGFLDPMVDTYGGVTKLVRGIQKSGAKVLWIGPVPKAPPWDKCVKGSSNISRCSVTNFAGLSLNPDVRAATEAQGAKFWNIQPLFCNAHGCPALIGGLPVRSDGFHLSLTATNGVQPQLRRAIRAALAH
ncbi:MAG: acyltransferase family protein [Actinomycetes bacterium]